MAKKKPAKPKPVPRWCCPECQSCNVWISLPAWFTEDDATLDFVEPDADADIKGWYCPDCDESGSDEPDENPEYVGP